ncbi:hypothetical protein [Pseudomonas reactans]
MSWVIYRAETEHQQRMYVTDIHDDSVGCFGGPGALNEACEWDSQADAQRALDWLNDPATHYGKQDPYLLEEKP